MNKETTMRELFNQFSEAIENIENYSFIAESMKRVITSPVVSFTANDEEIVLGQLFVVKSPGFYKVMTKGSGNGSYVVKNANTQKTIYSGRLKDEEVSAVLCLTQGDSCYFHASAKDSNVLEISLVQTHSLFDIMTEYLRDSTLFQLSINSRIDNIIVTAGNGDLPTELIDLRSDYWGEVFTTAGDRLRSTEKRIATMEKMAFPKFEDLPHSTTREYEAFTFVHDRDTYTSYVSRQDVPTGISLTNREYWAEWDVRDTQIQILSNQIEQLNNALVGIYERLEALEEA